MKKNEYLELINKINGVLESEEVQAMIQFEAKEAQKLKQIEKENAEQDEKISNYDEEMRELNNKLMDHEIDLVHYEESEQLINNKYNIEDLKELDYNYLKHCLNDLQMKINYNILLLILDHFKNENGKVDIEKVLEFTRKDKGANGQQFLDNKQLILYFGTNYKGEYESIIFKYYHNKHDYITEYYINYNNEDKYNLLKLDDYLNIKKQWKEKIKELNQVKNEINDIVREIPKLTKYDGYYIIKDFYWG